MPWKRRPLTKLELANDRLRTTICCLQRELENKQRAVSRFKVLVRERSNRIDQLTATIDRLREQNRLLDAEAEHLAEMIRFAPQLDAAMLAPK